MVKIRTRVHDKFSLEFKIWYEKNLNYTGNGLSGDKLKPEQFRQECWIFVPASLDVNALTYSREQFYSDITSYYRTITPVYNLRQMVGEGAINELSFCGDGSWMQADDLHKNEELKIDPSTRTPLGFLTNAVLNVVEFPTNANIAEYEYQIKMFCAIFKSACRERYNIFKGSENCETGTEGILNFRREVFAVLWGYGRLRKLLTDRVDDKLYDYYTFGEEFIINLAQMYVHKINGLVAGEMGDVEIFIKRLVSDLGKYKKERGYSVLEEGNDKHNANLLYRWSVLKKYVESDLFLSVDKRKSGVIAEQVYYSIAAGLSMIFATTVAFAFQQKYGNFTMPLFVALVVSYMLKDRIKELIRSAFASNRKLKYFDNKTILKVKDTVIGRSREGFDFLPQSKVPQHIMDIRSRSVIVDVENRINQESILFYRNLIELDSRSLESTSEYEIEGINKILLFNFSSFIKKMDNPQVIYPYVNQLQNGDDKQPFDQIEINTISVSKIYYINFIFQFTCNGEVSYHRYRVMMNRDGILELEQL
ncbi:MAG: hypothetical protein IKY70_03695 [Bacteroidales bacterium]|nr:hypothetical protein [Bacteroidales bacterium]